MNSKLRFSFVQPFGEPILIVHVLGSEKDKPKIIQRIMEVFGGREDVWDGRLQVLRDEFPDDKIGINALLRLVSGYTVGEIQGVNWSPMYGHSIHVHLS